MAFPADIIVSGFAATVAGSPWTSVNAGGAALCCWCRWDARQSREIPGTVVAPGHLPQHMGWVPGRTVRTSLLPPDPVCDFPFNRDPHSEALSQAFVQTLG